LHDDFGRVSVAIKAQELKNRRHGRHWMAITVSRWQPPPARWSSRGCNAVDSACAMIAATSTMWERFRGAVRRKHLLQPHTGKVIGINALGVAPTGATAESISRRA